MKKRGILCVCLLLCMAIVMGACSPGSTPQASGAATQPAAAQTSSSAGETPATNAAPQEITNITWFLSTGVVPSAWDEKQYVMKTITERTGVTVTATTPADDPDTKLNLMIVSGDLPDLLTFTNGTLIRDMVGAGLVWDLQEFFETYMPESHIIGASYPPFPEDIKERLIARDDGWYSFPSHIISNDNLEIWGLVPATEELWLSAKYRQNGGIIFNRNLMELAGVAEDDVKTESGLLAALEKVKQANLSIEGGSVVPLLADGNSYNGNAWESNGGALGVLTAFFGGIRVNSDGNFQSNYYNSQFKHAVQFLNTAARNGYLDANQFTWDRAAREAACRAGRVFCFIGNTADTGFYDTVNNGFEFYTPGVILSDTGEKPVLGYNETVGTGWLQNFVTKSTKEPEAVARFLDFMTGEEGLELWNYGESGIDYEINADGLFNRTEEGSKKANNAAVTGVGAFWAFCNQNFDRKYMDPSVDQGIVPQCAYGANPETVKYNVTALAQLPSGYIDGNPEMFAITNEVKSYVGTELANIILQATESDFDARYEALLNQLNSLGVPDLDAYINEVVQENFTALGYTLKPIN